MGGTPHPSAVLDLKSPGNNKAFYPPRLTSAQRETMPNPQAGALVYDTDLSTIFFFDGDVWTPMATTSLGQMLISRTASDGLAQDFFGSKVAISFDYALVSAPGSNSGQGAVYVFMRSGDSWIQHAKLTASDGAANDFFGGSLFLDFDSAVVGAHGDDVGSNVNQGSAYVFELVGTTWTQKAKLTASDGATNDYFGSDASINEDYVLIGVSNDWIGNNLEQGSAYVFRRSSGGSWVQQTKLMASDGAYGDRFGFSVSISGNTALIAATSADIGPSLDQGSVYVFVRSGVSWTQQAKLTANDGSGSDDFGCNVALSSEEDYALVGARYADIDGESSQGAAYVFVRSGNTWTQQAKLTASEGNAGDFFGHDVSLDMPTALIGAPGSFIRERNHGAAYAFVLSGGTWKQVRKIVHYSSSHYVDRSDNQDGTSVSKDIYSGRFIVGGFGFRNRKGRVFFGESN